MDIRYAIEKHLDGNSVYTNRLDTLIGGIACNMARKHAGKNGVCPDDMVQAAKIEVFARLKQYNPKIASPTTFIYTIVHHAIRHEIRSRGKHPRLPYETSVRLKARSDLISTDLAKTIDFESSEANAIPVLNYVSNLDLMNEQGYNPYEEVDRRLSNSQTLNRILEPFSEEDQNFIMDYFIHNLPHKDLEVKYKITRQGCWKRARALKNILYKNLST